MPRQRLYLRENEDAEIIAWLAQQENVSEAIRTAIYFYLEAQNADVPQTPDIASVPDKILERMLQERDALLQDALQDRERSLRRIIREELQRLHVTSDAPDADVDPDAGARLDDMF